ncbi:DivIVA domain-containing protein [Demequina muriae]|uniref:DivIVA domain-containing protein n=1 Tax=Demequina muriae TaxID=3051664 RepID=A0ABT8GDT7_9MICO|nr:DivIVA domain-containing protein [Demequina sp. EGI L300058]MDN4479597.1 DivIVA domain-containing protein [Demequina sp. EGI L300058]
MADLFPRVRTFALGYRMAEVDEYFNHARAAYEQPGLSDELAAIDVRRASFDLKRGGYSTAAVDSALDRLEVAFAVRVRERFIKEHGHDAWMAELARRAQVLYPRLRRPAGERFAAPGTLHTGYDRAEVDAALDRLTAFFDQGRPLTAEDVRSLTFKRRRAWGAYEERVVDAYLARTVDILLGAA